MVILVLYWK